MQLDLTEDSLLDGRIRLRQPAEGFRAAIDPVFLAAAVDSRSGQHAVELGAGTGAASLCLAHRVPGLTVHGIERDPQLVDLADQNATLNGMAAYVSFHEGDVIEAADVPGALPPADHVFANPPFWDVAASRQSPNPQRDRSVRLAVGDVADWVRAAAACLKPRGYITWVFPASRVDQLVRVLAPAFGGLILFPLWPKAGQSAKRVLVQARKDARSPACIAPGLVLHKADGAFTPEAQAVLRDGAPLNLNR